MTNISIKTEYLTLIFYRRVLSIVYYITIIINIQLNPLSLEGILTKETQ